MKHSRDIVVVFCFLVLSGCSASAQGNIPLPDASSRPTPLHFGLYVTPDPAQNPIDPPERFMGFHVGEDFEILPGEEDAEIPVTALCDGEIVTSAWVEGYGGLVRQHCVIDDQKVTVLYGHLALDSLIPAGQTASGGQRIGVLGAARSHDTDGNRKHLHLGILKGWGNESLGYVQTKEEIDAFVDPATVLP